MNKIIFIQRSSISLPTDKIINEKTNYNHINISLKNIKKGDIPP